MLLNVISAPLMLYKQVPLDNKYHYPLCPSSASVLSSKKDIHDKLLSNSPPTSLIPPQPSLLELPSVLISNALRSSNQTTQGVKTKVPP